MLNPFTSPKASQGFRNLDLLRALAVLCVFAAHLTDSLGFVNPGSLGRFGVVLFFVHTSFVLMYSLKRLDHSDKVNSTWHLCAVFFIRRFFRIYPLAIFVVLLTLTFRIPINPLDVWYWVGSKALLANIALVQNVTYSANVLAVLWSLPLEVQMYLMLPFAYLFLRKRPYASIGLWVVSLLLAFASYHASTRLSVFLFGPCFTSGLIAFDLIERIPRKLPSWFFLPALIAIVLAFRPLDNVPLNLSGKLPLAWGLSLLVGLLIAGCQDGQWRGIHSVAHWVAEHSYSIYLSHSPIFWLCLNVMRNSPWVVKLLLLAVLSVFVPMVLYRFIEKPLMDKGAQLASRWDARTQLGETTRLPSGAGRET